MEIGFVLVVAETLVQDLYSEAAEHDLRLSQIEDNTAFQKEDIEQDS